jgi:hypothetical protein
MYIANSATAAETKDKRQKTDSRVTTVFDIRDSARLLSLSLYPQSIPYRLRLIRHVHSVYHRSAGCFARVIQPARRHSNPLLHCPPVQCPPPKPAR